MIGRLIWPVVAAVLVAALGWAFWLRGDLAAARADLTAVQDDLAKARRSNAALQEQIAQSRLAREVEAARAARAREAAAAVQAEIETIYRTINDAPLDPALADRINRVR